MKLLVMVAGPYTAGGADEETRRENLHAMNRVALAVFERGHIPIIGVNNALPLIEEAGVERFDALMMPMSLALADRCDAVLRVGGPSSGADAEVERLRAAGKPVFTDVSDLPEVPELPRTRPESKP